MIITRIACIFTLINVCTSMESLSSWLRGETRIDNPREYAQLCLETQIYPIFTAKDNFEECSILSQSIPVRQLVAEVAPETLAEPILLDTNKGNKRVKCSIEHFRMGHYHTVVDYFIKYPGWFVGGYAISYFLPTMVSTPLLTAGLFTGLGYTYWQNQHKIMTAKSGWDDMIELFGLATPLGQAMIESGIALSPGFLPNGHIYYQGHIPNGIIPGQSLYIELEVKPLSEESAPN